MHRKGLLIGVMITMLGAGSVGAGEVVPMHIDQPQPLELELKLSADDWLLESGEDTRQSVYRGAGSAGGADRLAAADARSGSGFRVGPVVPALCEDDLPGTSTVVDAYSRAMECEDDQIGLSVSIRNY